MITSAFFTTAKIGMGTGGGNASYHEFLALQKISDVILSLDSETLNKTGTQGNVFMNDYIACAAISKMPPVDIAFFNGNPFGLTSSFLKNKSNGKTKLVVACPAHVQEESTREHKAFGIDFDFFYPHLVDPMLWDLYTQHIQMADLVFCPSKMSVEYLKSRLNSKAAYEVVPHGVDIPEKVMPLPEQFTPCYIGASGPDKGVSYLIRAWNQRSYNDSIMQIAGYGSQQMKELIYRTPSQGAKYNIHGYVKDISTVYNLCSVYIQPSVTEGFGLEVLEAMAHGRPIIVSAGAGVSELVEDGKEGFVVPARDVKALSEKIQYFKDNPDEVKRMGNNAREKAKQYPWDRAVEHYSKILSSLSE